MTKKKHIPTPLHDATVEALKADPDVKAAAEHGKRWKAAQAKARAAGAPYARRLDAIIHATDDGLTPDQLEKTYAVMAEKVASQRAAMDTGGFAARSNPAQHDRAWLVQEIDDRLFQLRLCAMAEPHGDFTGGKGRRAQVAAHVGRACRRRARLRRA